MSKIKLEGNALGTGTLTIAAPNTNTDRTLTLPDGAGEILVGASGTSKSTVAFHIEASAVNQSISGNTPTKVQFNQYPLDTESDWDSSNHRYVASVEGWYLVSGGVRVKTSVTGLSDHVSVRIFKNGSQVNAGNQWQFNTSIINNSTMPAPTQLIYLTASDYLDVYVEVGSSGATISDSTSMVSSFTGVLVRAA